MRVLVACEFSGVVRDAFIAAGHEAVSCDLLVTESHGPGMHIVGDAIDAIEDHPGFWDLLIAHPPCTFLANSGVRWLYGGKGAVKDPVRWAAMEQAAAFFRFLLDAPIPFVAVENPIMHRHGREIVGRGPDQLIQPWQYGHPETKATGLWLRGLPPLTPTNIVPGRQPRVHHASPGPDRWKERSRTLPGIAAAMAEQWGAVLLEKASMTNLKANGSRVGSTTSSEGSRLTETQARDLELRDASPAVRIPSLSATCEWCGVQLVADDGVWTEPGGTGDYCPEGLAVGRTGTSPHLPVRSDNPDDCDRRVIEAVRLTWDMAASSKRKR